MEDDDEREDAYAWEGSLDRTWETVHVQPDGTLLPHDATHLNNRRHAIANHQQRVKRGLMRALVLLVDASAAAQASDTDFKPSKLACLTDAAVAFVRLFLEQNPVSTLAVAVLRDGKAEMLTPLSCNARQHEQALRGIERCAGGSSLQNALELARECLGSVASFVSQEVIVLSASLASCDPGDISSTIDLLARERMRCSVFSITAEVYVYRKIARETSGEYGVALKPDHLARMLYELVAPRAINQGVRAPTNSLVRIGFPPLVPPGPRLSLLYVAGKPTMSNDGGYECPQCASMHAELPTECPLCGLKLVASTDLMKTYHHLFPLQSFPEVKGRADDLCDACGAPLPIISAQDKAAHGEAPSDAAREVRSVRYQCSGCHSHFCTSCDELLHDSVFACPGCLLGGTAGLGGPGSADAAG